MDDKAKKDGVEGEGSYSGTRDYNERTAQFLKKGRVEQAAKDAERALDSPEGAALKAAEETGRAGDPRHMQPSDRDVPDQSASPKDPSKAASRPR